MEENINALDETHKGACMGMDAISFVLDKVEDDDLKSVLDKEYNQYKEVSLEIEKIYPQYNDGKPHETGTMTKVMTWYGVEMKTLTDQSNSKVAELLLQGVNMGIIEGRKILNHKEIDETVNGIISKFVKMQESFVETLKQYL